MGLSNESKATKKAQTFVLLEMTQENKEFNDSLVDAKFSFVQ
jgi:hypothetical protein